MNDRVQSATHDLISKFFLKGSKVEVVSLQPNTNRVGL